jgi:hypothetical protein
VAKNDEPILKLLNKHSTILQEHSTLLREIRGRLVNMELVLPAKGEIRSIREELSRLKAHHADHEVRIDALEQGAR